MSFIKRLFDQLFNRNIKHMIRFSIVGVSNTLIDFLAFTVLYSVIGLSYIPSQILGYSAGILNSFIFNRRWTFGDSKINRSEAKNIFYELIKFITINLISLATSVIVMNLLVKYANMNVYLSKVMVIIVAQMINFLSYKLWVFVPKKTIPAATN